MSSFLNKGTFLVDLVCDMDMLSTAYRVGSVELTNRQRLEIGKAASRLAAEVLEDIDAPKEWT